MLIRCPNKECPFRTDSVLEMETHRYWEDRHYDADLERRARVGHGLDHEYVDSDPGPGDSLEDEDERDAMRFRSEHRPEVD